MIPSRVRRSSASTMCGLIGGTATFNNANAGFDHTVTLTGATLIGAAAGNYNLTSVATALGGYR